MNNLHYIKTKYSVAIEVAKSPQAVFHHLIYDVSKYWPEEMVGENAKLHDEFIFRIGDSHYSKNIVTEFVPDKKFTWLVTESKRSTDSYDWTGTKMTFELTPKGDHTQIEFTYDGPVLEQEYDRLIQICDLVVKEKLYEFLTKNA
jgi:hypothetical protein